MRPRARLVALGAVAFFASAPLVACFDLFHSTSFETACEIDAAACPDGAAVVASDAGDAGAADSGTDAPTDFCAWGEPYALQTAANACALLGACAGAVADDAYGPCLLRATLAYDCAANPNRPVIGAAHSFWDCMAKAVTCGDVEACVEPSGTRGTCQASASGFVACEGNANPASFVACGADVNGSSPRLGVENCASLGQTCTPVGNAVACGGSGAACTASGTSCSAGILHDCDPDAGLFDFGVDCASFGAGTCSSTYGACVAIGAGTCDAGSAVTCNEAIATGCPSGVPETVNCGAVPGLGCDPNAPGRAWDVSRACSDGPCASGDSCSGTVITSCVRGALVTYDCGGRGCTPVTYPGDSTAHYQCGVPVSD